MRAPVPALIYRPTRSASATVLALLLLIVGGFGTWLTGYRLLTGAWPQRTVTTLDAVGTVSFSSIAALITAGIAAVCGLLMLVAALWPGRSALSPRSTRSALCPSAPSRHLLLQESRPHAAC